MIISLTQNQTKFQILLTTQTNSMNLDSYQKISMKILIVLKIIKEKEISLEELKVEEILEMDMLIMIKIKSN